MTTYRSLHMFVYILLFAFVLVVSKKYGRIGSSPSSYNMGLFIIIIVASSIAGFRDIGVGTDTEIYVEAYYKVTSNISFLNLYDGTIDLEDYHDTGYLFLSWLSHFLPGSESSLLFLSSFVFLGFTGLALINMRKIIRIDLFFYFFLLLFIFYNQSYNYMRQFCALGILLYGYSNFLNSRYLMFALTLVSAYTFHSSSIVFLLVPFLYFFIYKRTNKIIKIALFASVVFLSLIVVFYFADFLSFLLSHGLVSELYESRYGASGDYDGDTFGKINVYLFIAELYLILTGVTRKVITNRDLLFLLSLYILGLALFSLSSFSAFLFRLSFYVSFVELLYFAHILSNKKYPILYTIPFCVVVLYYWVRNFIVSNACETYPYKSLILGI